MTRPICTILAGPNGSGKSSIHRQFRLPGEFVNTDEFAAATGKAPSIARDVEAGRAVIRRLDALVGQRASFVYETTLSSHQSLNLMHTCVASGYEVDLIFVALQNVELNILRVRERVARGGHDIPEATIRRRAETSFSRLPEAIQLCDRTTFFDNSQDAPRLMLFMQHGQVVERSLNPTLALDRRVEKAVRLTSRQS